MYKSLLSWEGFAEKISRSKFKGLDGSDWSDQEPRILFGGYGARKRRKALRSNYQGKETIAEVKLGNSPLMNPTLRYEEGKGYEISSSIERIKQYFWDKNIATKSPLNLFWMEILSSSNRNIPRPYVLVALARKWRTMSTSWTPIYIPWVLALLSTLILTQVLRGLHTAFTRPRICRDGTFIYLLQNQLLYYMMDFIV